MGGFSKILQRESVEFILVMGGISPEAALYLSEELPHRGYKTSRAKANHPKIHDWLRMRGNLIGGLKHV